MAAISHLLVIAHPKNTRLIFMMKLRSLIFIYMLNADFCDFFEISSFAEAHYISIILRRAKRLCGMKCPRSEPRTAISQEICRWADCISEMAGFPLRRIFDASGSRRDI